MHCWIVAGRVPPGRFTPADYQSAKQQAASLRYLRAHEPPLAGMDIDLVLTDTWRVRPADIQIIGEELAIKWDDGAETFIKIENLRRHCPCAGCKGEVDVMGNLYKNPDKPLSPAAFQLKRLGTVGGYALQPVWGDGHNTGLFAYDYLRRLGEVGQGGGL